MQNSTSRMVSIKNRDLLTRKSSLKTCTCAGSMNEPRLLEFEWIEVGVGLNE